MESQGHRRIVLSCVAGLGFVAMALMVGCSPSAPEAPKEAAPDPTSITLEVVPSPGGTIDPAPGKHAIARDQKIRLVATPDTDYVFDYWDGPLPANADPYVTPTVDFSVDRDLKTGVRWLHRPGMSAIDFVNDLAFFLKTTEEKTPVEQYDLNGEFSDSTAAAPVGQSTRKHSGNGMPDVAELYLLQVVLQSGRLDLTPNSGVASTNAWDRWDKNLKQAAVDLPGQDPRIQRVVAGYITLGDPESASLIRELVAWHFGLKLSGGYDHEMQRWLAFDEDADNDGTLNIEEWKFASPDGSLQNLAKFTAAALDRELPGQ